MKKLLFFLLTFIFFLNMSMAQQVKIKGQFYSKEHAQKAYLTFINGDDRVSDSVEIKNGKFEFTDKIIEPALASLSIRFLPKDGDKQPRMDGILVFLEAGNIQIIANDSLKFAVVTGSKAQKDYEAYKKLLTPFILQGATFTPRYRKFSEDKDEAGMKSIQDEYEAMIKVKNENVVKPYIIAHPESPIVLNLLNQYLGGDIDPAIAEPLLNNLSTANQNSFSGKSIKDRIDIAKKTAVGTYAMNFTQNDTLDKPVSLSDFKGKYVLIDFWASWCGPCRAENPNVVKAFDKYKDKNFTVLGVSLDQPGKHQSWIDAIHKDGLWWNQVSDLKFWDNAVAKQYGIRAIPQNLLIDPSGKIVAKNIRGDDLNKTLAEMIK